jgi:AraC-like DNA-binding protein
MADYAQSSEPLGKVPVQIGIVRPSPRLAGLIDSYYVVRTAQTVSDHYLASPGNLRLAQGEWVLTVDGTWVPTPHKTALFGPTDRSAVFGSRGPGVMLGAGLTPLGWAQLFDVPAREMSNRVDELSRFVGQADADALHAAVFAAADDQGIGAALDAWLIARAERRPPADPRIAAIHRALFDVPADVPAFAAAAGVSERTLQRLCDQAFGFGPKQLLRQKRFLRTLERVRGVLDQPLSGLIDEDYFDQAHFNRDFREFMGMSPTDYFNSPREIMRRAAEVRRTLDAPGMQGLEPLLRA